MRVLLPLYLPVAQTHTVYRTLGDLHDMLRHRHEAIARVGSQLLPFLPCPRHVRRAWCCVVVRATPQRGRGVEPDIGVETLSVTACQIASRVSLGCSSVSTAFATSPRRTTASSTRIMEPNLFRDSAA